MDNAIKNILPNIQRFVNRKLLNSRIENSSWYDTFNGREYSFMKDNRLLVEVSGQIFEGRWELLPNDKIVMNMDGTALAYNILFFKEHWIILVHPFPDNEPIILSDDISATIDSLMAEIVTNSPTGENIKADYISINGIASLTSDMFPGRSIEMGAKLLNDNSNLDGTYVHSKFRMRYLEIRNGTVTDIYYVKSYNTKIGNLSFKQKNIFIAEGDELLESSKDAFYQMGDKRSIRIDSDICYFDKNGKIINTRNLFTYIIIVMLFILIGLIVFLKIKIIYHST